MTIDLTAGFMDLSFSTPIFQDYIPQDFELTDPSEPLRSIEIRLAEGQYGSDVHTSDYVIYTIQDNNLAD